MILNIVSVANSIKSTKVKRPSRKTNFELKTTKKRLVICMILELCQQNKNNNL